jgi:excisionase family DNA binding protein
MTSSNFTGTAGDLAGRVTISVQEAGIVCGVGRSAAYDAVHRGEIPTVRIGRRYRVPVARLLAMFDAGCPTT